MIVRLVGPFQTPVKGYGKLASCAECTSLGRAQGHSNIYEVVVWNNRIMLCVDDLKALGLAIPVAIQSQERVPCPRCGRTDAHMHGGSGHEQYEGLGGAAEIDNDRLRQK